MLQVPFIRENKDEVITRLAKKNFEATAIVELVVELDEKRRNTQAELDNFLAESNKLSKDIGEMMKNASREILLVYGRWFFFNQKENWRNRMGNWMVAIRRLCKNFWHDRRKYG